MNEFEVVLPKRGVINAYLDRVAIGPDALLRPDHDRRRFLFSTLQRMIDGWQITMGLSLFIIWLACRRERIFLMTSGVILSHVAVALPAILGDGVLGETSLRLINHARFLTGSLVLPMALLFVRRPLPVSLGAFLLPPLIVAVSFLTLPVDLHRWRLTTVYLPIISAAALWGLSVVVRLARYHGGRLRGADLALRPDHERAGSVQPTLEERGGGGRGRGRRFGWRGAGRPSAGGGLVGKLGR